MSKTIKINGEFTKEELQEKIKEFDKPKWEVKKAKKYITLFKDNKYKRSLLYEENEHPIINLSTISRYMAKDMDDLMETEDVLDYYKVGHSISFNASYDNWRVGTTADYTSDKHFKTRETAELAAKLLNESKDMQDWIERMSK